MSTWQNPQQDTGDAPKFRLEDQMAYHVKTWLEIRGFQVKQEFRTPWGICDLVAVHIDSKYFGNRINAGQLGAVGPIRRVAILNEIPAETNVHLEEIFRRVETIAAPAEVLQDLAKLTIGKFVRETAPHTYRRLLPSRSRANKILSIELKLDRVEEVISQAVSNLTFSDESFIALPDSSAVRVMRSSRVEHLKELGVGVLAVARGGCEILLASTGNTAERNDAAYLHCIERFWRDLINKTA